MISEIKNLAKKADEILLATDPDREGEAIAWHIAQILKDNLGNTKSGNRNPKHKKPEIKRVSYHEITKEAVLEALKHPRDIDQNLRKAQEARRVLDRLVGYDLSGLIWKKVRYGLSAGRVQSPALRILMEREREIRAFTPETYFVLSADFNTDKKEKFTAFCEIEPKTKEEALKIAEYEGLDLIEINPNTTPPICKIIDYSKYMYDKKKKQKKTKLKQKNKHTFLTLIKTFI